jgi:hypothetical protein
MTFCSETAQLRGRRKGVHRRNPRIKGVQHIFLLRPHLRVVSRTSGLSTLSGSPLR